MKNRQTMSSSSGDSHNVKSPGIFIGMPRKDHFDVNLLWKAYNQKNLFI